MVALRRAYRCIQKLENNRIEALRRFEVGRVAGVGQFDQAGAGDRARDLLHHRRREQEVLRRGDRQGRHGIALQFVLADEAGAREAQEGFREVGVEAGDLGAEKGGFRVGRLEARAELGGTGRDGA